MNNYYEIVIGEATVCFWESECVDCRFKTGLACVKYADNTGFTISGSGCYSRRDLKAVEKLIREKLAQGR